MSTPGCRLPSLTDTCRHEERFTPRRRRARRPPGETAVVIVRPDELPALVGLCRLPLGMERVEGLFQAVLGRFPGIDGVRNEAFSAR
jgi:hypothetical protein